MGLDIYLIEIVNESELKFKWLSDEENPELRTDYSEFLTTRKIKFENGKGRLEKGYHSIDISYQRKRVKPKFFKNFEADDFIFTLDKLLELKKFVKKEYLESFESDFMQKFKEKENFVLISY